MSTPGQEKQRLSSSLCANACGFYGNATTRNLCSKCYRDAIEREQIINHQSAQFQDKLKASAKQTTQNSELRSQLQEAQQQLPIDQIHSYPKSIAPGSNNFIDKNSPSNSSSEAQSLLLSRNLSTERNLFSDVNLDNSVSIDSSEIICTEESQKNLTSSFPLLNHNDCKPDSFTASLNEQESISLPSCIYSTSELAEKGQELTTPFLGNSVVRGDTAEFLEQELKTSSNPADEKLVLSPPPNEPSISSTIDVTQTSKTRCHKCNKRIGLLGFQCRCAYYFCGAHRHADCHDCSFDFKTFGRQQLLKANQKIVADKLNRI